MERGRVFTIKKIGCFVLILTGVVLSSVAPPVQVPAMEAQVWHLGIVDNCGGGTSLALDAEDRIHISYCNWNHKKLKYAQRDAGTWSLETVDAPTSGTIDYEQSLVLDSMGRPHISYSYTLNLPSNLKYARWDGAAWQLETVDPSGDFSSLALDAMDRPHISYYEALNDDLKYARWTGTVWQLEIVDSAGNVGFLPSLALDSADRPHISYYDITNKDLKYARWDGAAWQLETVDSAGDVGEYSSLALDSTDRPCISYYDPTNKNLNYAQWTGTAWQLETVDSPGNVGKWPSLALDSTDRPRISYYDITNKDLKFARWDGNEWHLKTVDAVEIVGKYTSLALDSEDSPHISYLDDTNEELKYASRRVDTDGDKLSDISERQTYGTDPNNADTDDDGLTDGLEVITYGTDPTNNDTDGDGLSDGEEVKTYGTSPTVADTDGDGLADDDELERYKTDPLVSDATADTDGDKLPNVEEVDRYGTDPKDADTDDDGITDGKEVELGTDPKDPSDFPPTTSVANRAPTIKVVQPNGGEQINGTYEIRWEATDPDGDVLTFTISYSPNRGQTWTQLTSGVTGTSYQWDTSGVQEGANYLVKVEASDGDLMADDRSDAPFSIGTPVGEFLPRFGLVVALGAILALAGFRLLQRRRTR